MFLALWQPSFTCFENARITGLRAGGVNYPANYTLTRSYAKLKCQSKVDNPHERPAQHRTPQVPVPTEVDPKPACLMDLAKYLRAPVGLE